MQYYDVEFKLNLKILYGFKEFVFMSRTYSAIITGLLAGLTVGISSFILETLKVENTIFKAIVFCIAVFIILKILRSIKCTKQN